MEKFLDFEEALSLLPYRRSYLYKLMHERQIPYFKPTGGRVMFLESDIEDFITRGRKDAGYECGINANAILNRPKKRGKFNSGATK